MTTQHDQMTKQLLSVLKQAGRPLNCDDLYKIQEVKDMDISKSDVSRKLSDLWRRKQLERRSAPKKSGSYIKYAYKLPKKSKTKVDPAPAVKGPPITEELYTACANEELQEKASREALSCSEVAASVFDIKEIKAAEDALEVSLSEAIRTMRIIFGDVVVELRLR